MADENQPPGDDPTTEQLELSFPSTDGFPDYDEVDSDVGQSFLPPDNFDESQADFDSEGCGCVK